MIATILGLIVKYLTDDVVTAIFNLITGEMHDRGLIAQGQAQQHTSDLQATVKESTDAAEIRGQVQGEPDSALDADLERLQHPAGPTGNR